MWAAIEDVASHVEWMEDAVAIRFTSPRRSGIGASFDCDTKVGPLRLTDRMEITEWRPRRAMGIRHVGVVTGEGRFSLQRRRRLGRGRGTRFTWEERLVFPWFLGGPFGAVVGGQVLRLVWRRNLHNLKRRVEGGPAFRERKWSLIGLGERLWRPQPLDELAAWWVRRRGGGG